MNEMDKALSKKGITQRPSPSIRQDEGNSQTQLEILKSLKRIESNTKWTGFILLVGFILTFIAPRV
jgi:hypothetical protein